MTIKRNTIALKCISGRGGLLAMITMQVIGIGVCKGVPFPEKKALTVAAAVEMTRVVPIGRSEVDVSLVSPSGEYAVIHTRTPNIATNTRVEKLIIYETKSLSEYCDNRTSEVPAGRIVAELVTTRDDGGIDQIKWSDGSRLSFIAESSTGVIQGFSTDVRAGRTVQVTRSSTDVAAFAAAGGHSLFYRRLLRPPRLELVAVVRDGGAMFPNEPDDSLLQLSFTDRGGSEDDIGGPVRLVSPQVWLSPNGERGIVTRPATGALSIWEHYEMYVPDFRWTADKLCDDPTSATMQFRTRYEAIDLRAKALKPLPAGPIATGSFAQAPVEVLFIDEKRAIVSHIWMPLSDISESERRRRESSPAIAEVDLETFVVEPIFFEPDGFKRPGVDIPRRFIDRLTWIPKSEELRLLFRWKGGRLTAQSLQRRTDGWRVGSEDAFYTANRDAVTIVQRQGLNSRPKLFVAGHDAQSEKFLFDPAPEAEHLEFGLVEEIVWEDVNGNEWKGLLVKPVGHREGVKYPLVVQTHGYRAGSFLLDGPGREGGTAFAAQALANAGFFVLQISDPPVGAFTQDEREASLTSEGFRAGIEKITARADIDGDKLGILAFSRTGLAVPLLMAEHPTMFRAAIFADTGWWTYISQLNYVFYPDLSSQFVQLQGGWTAKDDPEKWFKSSPLYKIVGGSTAVRIEATSGLVAVAGNFEYFALMRARRRPVDFVYYPQGSHNLRKPVEMLASQQGTVDWFAFWLQNREIEPQSKVEQYARWRKLKGDWDRQQLWEADGHAVGSVPK
jgi:hypothetical protein